MIPTPRRVRANRRLSAAAGGAVALATAAGGWAALDAGWLPGVVLLAALAGWAVYRFGTRVMRRRLAVLARPFPPQWQDVLEHRVAYYRALSEPERLRFRRLVAIFLDETRITPAGCEVDDTCRVLVAAAAVIPIFGFPAWEYASLREVVVRGERFDFRFPGEDRPTTDILGFVGNTGGAFHGTVVLSRADLLEGFASAGRQNVGIHEFAHLIDQADGAVDGIPASLPPECIRPWLRLVRRELERGWRGWSDIPRYGFTNETEFFAVASEYFFQAPSELARNHPELYALLRRAFRQNTAARLRTLLRRPPGRRRRTTRRARHDGPQPDRPSGQPPRPKPG